MKVSKKLDSARDAALRKAVRRKTSDSTEQTAFHIAVKNVEEILKKKQGKVTKAKKAAQIKVEEPVKTVEVEKKPWQGKGTTGVMYLGHIPHGFYEDQMLDYFKQFGKVKRVRVARSSKTGQSRGYGFVEFEHNEVAKIAAETMNNYLMCGRLLKATYIPPEKQHGRYFSGKDWTKENYPKLRNRLKTTKLTNAKITDKKHRQYVGKSLKRLSTLQKSLESHGISIKFTPTSKPKLQEK